MKVTVRDDRVLSSVNPQDVLVYLRWLGWEEIQHFSGRLTVFAPPDPAATAARVPLNPQFRDYSQSISDVLKAVEAVTHRSQLDILDGITVGNKDVVEVRKDTPEVSDGTIPAREARELVQHGYNLMMAGASSAFTLLPVYLAKKPAEVSRFMDDVRMGQTKRGSFILTFLTPIPPSTPLDVGSQDLPVGTPFSRQATEVLAKSLRTVELIARESLLKDDILLFKDGVKDGVSANLCEAVVGLQERAGGGTVEFKFDWSKGRPAPATVPESVTIAPSIVPVLRSAAYMLRSQSSDRTLIKGFVLRIGREEWNQDGGWIVMQVNINNTFRPVRCDLSHDEFSQASKAIDLYRPVEVSGTLKPGGIVWHLDGAQQFRLLEPDEFDAGEATIVVLEPRAHRSPTTNQLALF